MKKKCFACLTMEGDVIKNQLSVVIHLTPAKFLLKRRTLPFSVLYYVEQEGRHVRMYIKVYERLPAWVESCFYNSWFWKGSNEVDKQLRRCSHEALGHLALHHSGLSSVLGLGTGRWQTESLSVTWLSLPCVVSVAMCPSTMLLLLNLFHSARVKWIWI